MPDEENIFTPETDPSTDATISIDSAHAQVHKGRSFAVSKAISLGAADSEDLLFETDSDPNMEVEFHVLIALGSDNAVVVSLYEESTVQTPGTPIVPINRNRVHPFPSKVANVQSDTVFSDDGDLLIAFQVGGKNIGEYRRGDFEFILKEGTKYLVRVATGVGITAEVNLVLDWYETFEEEE